MESIIWREVFDCKITSTLIEDCFKMASKANYKYFCHNNKIYYIVFIGGKECYDLINCIKIKD